MPTSLPDPRVRFLAERVDAAFGGRHWTGNEDEAGEHHGLVPLNEVPCLVTLSWFSRSRGETVLVGTYKLNLRLLAQHGDAEEKGGRLVRLRFVRDPDGTVEIRPNDSSPGLAVGVAWPTGEFNRSAAV